ncbi:MAG: hypothetical protein KF800_19065 [Lysobacter sp.]|nr:hypothetical protein [Lysobacter sp.]
MLGNTAMVLQARQWEGVSVSTAGVRSSRGDTYQSWVATRYVVEMISDANIKEIEIDATSLDRSGEPVLVDDVVVRYSDQNLYIQAKKNQTDFRAWPIADLGDELGKAWQQWRREPLAQILFISRNDFGDLAKIAEHATTQATADAFEKSLSAEQKRISDRVREYDQKRDAPQEDLFMFLRQMTFETISQERLSTDIKGLLAYRVAHVEEALSAIRQRVGEISGREVDLGGLKLSRDSILRHELLHSLQTSGIEVCLPKAEKEARMSLVNLSQIGRNWQRKIGGKTIERTATDAIISKIAGKPSCLVLSAGPGVGKTCVLLSVLEQLEKSPLLLPVFVQAREFSGLRSHEEWIALGFPSSFMADVARMSELYHVIVLIDSLDVLSIARDHSAMSHTLSLIDRLRIIPNVTVVVACRSFDLKHDMRLSARDWGELIEIDLLDWDSIVAPMLVEAGIDAADLVPNLRKILCNPRLLAIFHEIVSRGAVPLASSAQDLTECYLDRVVRQEPSLGEDAIGHIMRVASWMLDNRRLDMPVIASGIPQNTVHSLLSAGVLVETSHNGLSFAHQTLLDVLAVANARAEGTKLAAFIRGRAAAPFVRPTVRAHIFSLRLYDITSFRREIREVVDAVDIAFHLRRLVAESIAEVLPEQEDWPLVRHIFTSHKPLFEALYSGASSEAWTSFFLANWLPKIIRDQDGAWLVRFLDRVAVIADSNVFVNLWQQAFDWGWVDKQRLKWISSTLLDRITSWDSSAFESVFLKLTSDAEEDHGSLGSPISKWVDATNDHDSILWGYITRRVDAAALDSIGFDDKLNCAPHVFCRESFLADRMRASEVLLDLALNSIEEWCMKLEKPYDTGRNWSDGLLRHTRYEELHTARDMHHVDSLNILMMAIEDACLFHAKGNSSWWNRNIERLRNSRDAALRYFALRAMAEYPELNAQAAASTLLDREMLESSRFSWEMGKLINAAYLYMSPVQQDELLRLILALDEDERNSEGNLPIWVLLQRRDYLVQVPAYHRSKEARELVAQVEALAGPSRDRPDIHSWGGFVRSPVSYEDMLGLSDQGLLRLLKHYPSGYNGRWERSEFEHLMGGSEQVANVLREAASRRPSRALRFLKTYRIELEAFYREAIVSGVALHLRYRFGNLGNSSGWAPQEEPNGESLAISILNELESHYDFWKRRREMADSLYAISRVVESSEDGERLAFLLIGCLSSDDPSPDREDGDDKIFVAINSTRGVAVEAAFALSNRWTESGRTLPAILVQVLMRAASDPHPSIRALTLQLLPYVLRHHRELGWLLFERAIFSFENRAWKFAYNCLYYNYHHEFARVRPYLGMLRQDGTSEGLKIWGRIAGLCCLSGHIGFEEFITEISSMKSNAAWSGAASVFSANIASEKHKTQCEIGLISALDGADGKAEVLRKIDRVFYENPGLIIDLKILRTYLSTAMTLGEDKRNRNVRAIGEWLAPIGSSDPDYALEAAEIILQYADLLDLWNGEPYTKLLTALFREAEERELSDKGEFLSRVVNVQDALLRRGVHKLEDWLKDAERP